MFNSALALQPHLYLLVPEGMWSEGGFVPLPPPTTEEVESVLARMTRQLLSVFESVEATWPEDGFEALQAEGAEEAEPGPGNAAGPYLGSGRLDLPVRRQAKSIGGGDESPAASPPTQTPFLHVTNHTGFAVCSSSTLQVASAERFA